MLAADLRQHAHRAQLRSPHPHQQQQQRQLASRGSGNRAGGRRCGARTALPPAFGGDDTAPHGDFSTQEIVRETIRFVSSEGIVSIPGRELAVPRPRGLIQPLPTAEEQGLCIGATFALAATNGVDFDRRICFLGFCQSVDVIGEALAETVASRGGEVLEAERRLKAGVHEQLKMTVCIPFLFGVPPEVDALSAAIASAGGVVHQVQRQWGIYRPAFRRRTRQQSHRQQQQG